MAGDAPVERVLIRGGRAVGVAVGDGLRLTEIGAPRVVLSAGAYGSPAILLRSGIGPADELIAIGLKPTLDLPGVARNLHDQPMGPASDPDSVADSEGRVHGIEGLYVADASLMPAVISGNTNMPTTVIGERIARSLLKAADEERMPSLGKEPPVS